MIVVKNLTKIYGHLTAVDRLSFDAAPGEIVGLIGPNGAGKTSTLRCIAGILRPTSGSITINGHDIVGSSVEAKRHIAFVADEPELFEYLTVSEHLRLVGRIYQVHDAEPRARRLIEQMQLTGKENALTAELSRGMKQKVAIACGLMHDPRAMLLDEPLTGLDPLGIRHMRETITAQAALRTAVIVSSHLLHLVEEICTRIVIMHRGARVADGTLSELAAQARAAGAGSTLEEIFLNTTRPGA